MTSRTGPAASAPSASSLSAGRRTRDLTAAVGGDVVDVLVVGLGATGAGAALDAASRGLSVVAVDAHDLAFGTSRFSSKLVHGGLRYLASGQLDVAHESAVERGALMERTAPIWCAHSRSYCPSPLWSPPVGPPWRGPASGPVTPCGWRPGPRVRPCPRRAGSRRRRPAIWPPPYGPTGCAAACCPGTAGSPTTPGW